MICNFYVLALVGEQERDNHPRPLGRQHEQAEEALQAHRFQSCEIEEPDGRLHPERFLSALA
jgi:hypothetical protein